MYFTFKGQSSEEHNITILRSPKIKTPDYRRYITEIPGRHGAHIETKGLTSHTFSIDISVPQENITDVLGWLRGRGIFSYHRQPKRFLEVDIQAEVEFEHVFDGTYVATVTFYTQDATWFEEGEITVESHETTVENRGTFTSRPIIHIYNGQSQTWKTLQGKTWKEWNDEP